MTKQKCGLEERREKIMDVAATDYENSDDAAGDYLAIIEGANLDEQKQLFRLILAIHGARRLKKHKCPPPNSIQPKEWKAIAGRVGPMAIGWSRSAIRNNAGLNETADMLWDELTLCEGKDRIVALGILLDQPAVPYVQLPGSLTVVKAEEVYRDAHDRILDQVALLERLKNTSDITILECSVALTRILERIEGHEERVAFLAHFLQNRAWRRRQAGLAKSVLDFLGEVFDGGNAEDD